METSLMRRPPFKVIHVSSFPSSSTFLHCGKHSGIMVRTAANLLTRTHQMGSLIRGSNAELREWDVEKCPEPQRRICQDAGCTGENGSCHTSARWLHRTPCRDFRSRLQKEFSPRTQSTSVNCTILNCPFLSNLNSPERGLSLFW